MSLDYDTGTQSELRSCEFSAIIAYNLVNSFYDGLPWNRVGFLRATELWSEHYQIGRVL